jgi:hypothetical protein
MRALAPWMGMASLRREMAPEAKGIIIPVKGA